MNVPSPLVRRAWLGRVAAAALASIALGIVSAPVPARAEPVKELRIGFQKSASLLVLVSGYIALELSNHVFDIGEKASATIEAGI